MIDASQRMLKVNSQGEGMSPPMKKHRIRNRDSSKCA
jgi:hypothetical protein